MILVWKYESYNLGSFHHEMYGLCRKQTAIFMFLFSSGGLEITVEGKNLNASMAPKLGGTFEVDGNMYEFGAESVSLIKHNS